MADWYKLDLGNGADAFATTRKIQDTFIDMLMVHGVPRPEMAMFSRYDLRADNVEVYFTPATSDLAMHFGAKLCDKPAHNEYPLGLLCGEANGLLFHFPDHPGIRR